MSITHPLLPSPPPLLCTILSSGVIQSILRGDCSREKDVAEANERIITTGSKQSSKSFPSGHDSFRMKQRKSKARQRGPCAEREERGDKRTERTGEGDHKVCMSWGCSSHTLLFDQRSVRSFSPSVSYVQSYPLCHTVFFFLT